MAEWATTVAVVAATMAASAAATAAGSSFCLCAVADSVTATVTAAAKKQKVRQTKDEYINQMNIRISPDFSGLKVFVANNGDIVQGDFSAVTDDTPTVTDDQRSPLLQLKRFAVAALTVRRVRFVRADLHAGERAIVVVAAVVCAVSYATFDSFVFHT